MNQKLLLIIVLLGIIATLGCVQKVSIDKEIPQIKEELPKKAVELPKPVVEEVKEEKSKVIEKVSENERDWIKELIQKEIDGRVANPPASLSKCVYKGDVVYYLPPRCCDISSALYNKDGDVICSPDGGFTGSGDGRCTDFFNERTDCEVIWKDSRSYP